MSLLLLFNGAAAGVDVQATSVSLVLTERQATVSLDRNVLANTDALILTEQPATVSLNVDVAANTDALILTEHAATVEIGSADVVVSASVVSLTLTENAATVSLNVDVQAQAAALFLTTYPATVEGASPSVQVPTDSLGANDRHWRRGRAKLRRVPTAEEVYRQAVNPPPSPLLDAPGLADIPDEVDREIAYRMRAAEVGRLSDQVARALAREKLEAEFNAAQAQQEEDDAILAIMTMVLMEAA